jgi:N-methylhydantoinase B
MDAIELSLFHSRLGAICEEMGAVLQRAALSPNIKERLDFSCAIFDRDGDLAAQAAHIPVHLGSMAYATRAIVGRFDWHPGDLLVLNDPYLGGTHLPDVTLIAPVFCAGERVAFVANRAHHANIGAEAPGSMPVSRRLDEEGLLISPSWLFRSGTLQPDLAARLAPLGAGDGELPGDFAAQVSANRVGGERLAALVAALGTDAWQAGLSRLNAYGAELAASALAAIPTGRYTATDWLDDDGQGNEDLPIAVCVEVADGRVAVDFAGTAPQSPGNVNCPLPVTAAAVFFVLRCLMAPQTPACAGTFSRLCLQAPEASLVNARPPAAVAAGNVETSMRIVDVVAAALASALPDRIPAASQGTMNNVAMGARPAGGAEWHYYETIAGGAGAGSGQGGASAVQSHMTNTMNTPIESLEMHFPLRITRYAIRRGSGGTGRHRGGDGLQREFEFLGETEVSLLSERRRRGPPGAGGGAPGQPGSNRLNGRILPGKAAFTAAPGDRLLIETPGGGGWGQ